MRPQWLQHPSPGGSLAWLLLLLALPGAAQGSFEVSISPEAAMVEHGGSVWINCSHTCQDPGASGGLETVLTKTNSKSGAGWAAFLLVGITEWVSAPQCYFTCSGVTNVAAANISAYRPPERVVLEPLPEMELGQAYNLTCRVLNVAPVKHLTVTLRQGGRTLHTETFQNRTGTGPDNVTVTHEIIPQRRDHGQEFACHAALDLRPHGQLLQNSSPAVELRVFGAAEQSFNVSVWPEDSVVEHGGSIWLNCSHTCRDPGARGGLETSLTKAKNKSGPRWMAQELVGIREWLSAPQCYFNCYGNVTCAVAHITTYRPPERVVLEPLPEMELGQAYNLTCRVLNVAPVKHLTVTLRQGGRTLHTETFQNRTGTGPDNVTVTHEIIPQRRDHGQEFACHAALDLRPHGQLLQNSSPAVELRVFDLPEEPQLQTSLYIEVGTRAPARCAVARVFPAVGEARFTLSFGGESLEITVTTSGDTATALGEVWSPSPGQHQLSCTVTVGPVSRSAGRSVLVYSFPQPVLEIDQPQALVNRNVSVTCSAPASQPPGTTLQLRDSEQTLVSGRQPHLQLTLTTRKGDNGRQFTCEGNLTLGSRSLVKNTSAQLIVLYQPTLDESGCPSHQTWLEGTPQQLACEADGNPTPEVSCSKDSQVHGPGAVQNVTRGHAGVYRCSAANAHGTAGRNVTIHVEYKPTMDESSCPSTQVWLEGTLHTLACEADGIPVPRVPCTKEGAADEFGGERNVSRNDSGTYHCTATNRLGSMKRRVTVRVEYRPIVLLLAVSPSDTVPRGANFNVSCRAEGSPAPAYRWTVPPAPNVHTSADNSTVSVAGADRHNRGVYVCRVSNAHGQHLGQVRIQVTDHRLIIAALIAGAAVLLLGGTAGLIYYLKSTACKKGEYNVQDAESSAKATCLGRDGAVYGIQLTQT
ncbi:intercellular adhesion molecule 5-like isoform X1 [Mauremys mutica]|uniref:intercellular adhesion molecule 5-like isoform X1 n=1 Tax=Mauremys mutica TaxID=74926 RepID=UPI001D1612FA|nr:intercellular adhesion molecule 5-like isoform X1 [Mauremys mutica]